jgi:DNA-binding beta-propeller fold protein YncE
LLFLCCVVPAEAARVKSFVPESHYAVPGGEVAEIVAASADGMFLYYTNASGKKVGVLDISDPANPKAASYISTGEAEPTSAAVSSDGKNLIVVMRNGDGLNRPAPGTLSLYDISDAGKPSHAGDVEIGIGPDSAALASRGGNLVAVVAIEDEEGEAAVTLQENNAVAVIDISNPEEPKIKNVFCAGTVERKADLKKDGSVDFSGDFKGRREPDGIAYVTVGDEIYLAVANEGDTSLKTFGDGVYSGGRGVSLLRADGTPVWDSGAELERAASRAGTLSLPPALQLRADVAPR